MQSSQMHSFSIHLIAEEMNISRDDIFNRYDEIENNMLEKFFNFLSLRHTDAIWIHWNMTNINFGFETIEHRYKVLSRNEPIHIAKQNKFNISNLLKKRYGSNYANDPKMLNLMELNGCLDRNFLTGEEEVRAYKAKEFVKLHNSTMCKVYFFRDVYGEMICNKLRTNTNKFRYKVNVLYQNTIVQIIGIIGIIGSITATIIAIIK